MTASKESLQWILGPTLTPLAMTGHPANKRTASKTKEKTCAVDGRREARTIEAERAEVKDRDDAKLSENELSGPPVFDRIPPFLLY